MSVQTAAVPQLTRGRLATFVASRFVLNAIFRLAYPLVPFLALRFNVLPQVATAIVTVQVALGLMSLLGGWLGDRIGYRRTMMIGLGCTLTGVVGIITAPVFAWLLVGYGLCGIGGALYLPAMQAYVSSMTTYEQRGRAIGIVELSWALAGLLAVPLLMWLVDVQDSIQGAFSILAGCVVLVLVTTYTLMPEEGPRHMHSHLAQPRFLDVLRQPSVLALCAFLFLVVAGNEILFVAQAPWATERFGATPAQLGTAAFVFGIGELGGSILSTLFTDRLGKLRASVIGFGLTAIIFVVLPLVSATWLSYLGIYTIYGLGIEFAIVAAITLSSTVSAHGRGSIMALAFVASQVGRALGSQLGVPVLAAGSLLVNGVVAAAIVLVGVVIAWRGISESKH